ncbi:MAG: hypothetical protein AAF696_07585, partial [Bacteroidota bacterium]
MPIHPGFFTLFYNLVKDVIKFIRQQKDTRHDEPRQKECKSGDQDIKKLVALEVKEILEEKEKLKRQQELIKKRRQRKLDKKQRATQKREKLIEQSKEIGLRTIQTSGKQLEKIVLHIWKGFLYILKFFRSIIGPSFYKLARWV